MMQMASRLVCISAYLYICISPVIWWQILLHWPFSFYLFSLSSELGNNTSNYSVATIHQLATNDWGPMDSAVTAELQPSNDMGATLQTDIYRPIRSVYSFTDLNAHLCTLTDLCMHSEVFAHIRRFVLTCTSEYRYKDLFLHIHKSVYAHRFWTHFEIHVHTHTNVSTHLQIWLHTHRLRYANNEIAIIPPDRAARYQQNDTVQYDDMTQYTVASMPDL